MSAKLSPKTASRLSETNPAERWGIKIAFLALNRVHCTRQRTLDMRRTARLTLQRPRLRDLARFIEICSDPRTNRYNPHGPLSHNEATDAFEGVQNQWKKHAFGVWKVEQKDNPGEAIGFGGASYRCYADCERLNLGFRFDTLSWGQGFATELAQSTIEYCFDVLQKDEIFALVRPDNLASIRVLEKSGMSRWDTLPDVPGQPPSLVFRSARSNKRIALQSDASGASPG